MGFNLGFKGLIKQLISIVAHILLSEPFMCDISLLL